MATPSMQPVLWSTNADLDVIVQIIREVPPWWCLHWRSLSRRVIRRGLGRRVPPTPRPVGDCRCPVEDTVVAALKVVVFPGAWLRSTIPGEVARRARLKLTWAGDRSLVREGRSSSLSQCHVAETVPSTAHTPLCVLAIADEWFPGRGGLSALNRYLCIALADAGMEVFCVVPSSSKRERADAAAVRVHLIDALALPGGSAREALMRKPPLPDGVIPQVIIGHGRVTGPAAKVLADDHYPNAARLHFVHMEPDQVEWYKLDRQDDTAEHAEERAKTELELGRDATRVVAIGPKLYRWFSRDLSVFASTPCPLRLDPGFDGFDQEARTTPPGEPQILALGRMEDTLIKGLDIASKAVGHAVGLRGLDEETVELLIRGAPHGQAEHLRNAVRDWVGHPSVRVTVRNYSTDFERVRQDLRRASLVLMPSRAEGFGLVGLEAIVAGTPVLVSDKSGLGMLLREVLPREDAARIVVPVYDEPSKDVPLWGHMIAAVLRDRAAAFSNAATARRVMAERRTWATAAMQVLSAVSVGGAQS